MNNYSRHDKIDWLQETCSKDFLENHLMSELINWMGEDDFEEFYDHLIRNWDIKRDPNDPKYDAERDDLG